jgi:flagellar motor protein MotB
MSLFCSRQQNRQTDDENPYWISFADIMSGLLVIFVLAALALILELTTTRTEVSKAISDLAQAEQSRRDIIREVESELKKKGIIVEVSDNETVLRIPEQILSFKQDHHEFPLKSSTADHVLAIGSALHAAITRDMRWKHLDTIFIEGHTDPLRTKKYRLGNWELSTLRAIYVWKYWDDNLPSKSRLSDLVNHSEDQPLFSVSGYGGTRFLERKNKEKTKNYYSRLRRIDLRITVRKPEIKNFEDIRNKLGKN